MKKEMNNKGFSLVELIIVIAIMAVLVGLLAPQYLKYVNNSKVSTDISNAQDIATAWNVAFADCDDPSTLDLSKLPNGDAYPASKYNGATSWNVDLDPVDGVTSITLDSLEIWPDPKAAGNYYAVRHKN